LDEVLRDETAFLPKRLNAVISKNQDPRRIRRCRFWRNILERLILALADQQLITGFAILITGWIVYHERLNGAHFTLVIYISCLSSSSHLAAIITLRKYFNANPTLALLRIAFISAFALVLAISILYSNAFGPFFWIFSTMFDWFLFGPWGWLFSIGPVLWTFWTGIWQIVPETRVRFTAWVKKTLSHLRDRLQTGVKPMLQSLPRLNRRRAPRPRPSSSTFIGLTNEKLKKHVPAIIYYLIFLSPCSVFVLQIIFATISIAMVLAQKFSPGHGIDECSLNSKEENQMGYGQILTFLMLILIIIAAVEAYKGKPLSTPSCPVQTDG
jgi:hypothetical protein